MKKEIIKVGDFVTLKEEFPSQRHEYPSFRVTTIYKGNVILDKIHYTKLHIGLYPLLFSQFGNRSDFAEMYDNICKILTAESSTWWWEYENWRVEQPIENVKLLGWKT